MLDSKSTNLGDPRKNDSSDYTVTVTATAEGNDPITGDFTLTIKNPCIDSDYVKMESWT